MKKKLLSLCVTVLLLAALLPLTVQTAFAQDYDRILSYQVDVTPNVNDGSLAIRLSFRWKALEDLPATNSQKGGAKIGIPNGSIRDMKALSDNIADIQNDNSYAYVDFTQGYRSLIFPSPGFRSTCTPSITARWPMTTPPAGLTAFSSTR